MVKNRVKDLRQNSNFSKSQRFLSENHDFQFTFLVRRSVPSTPWCFDPRSYACPRWTGQLDHRLSGILCGGATGAKLVFPKRRFRHNRSHTNAGRFVFDPPNRRRNGKNNEEKTRDPLCKCTTGLRQNTYFCKQTYALKFCIKL